MNHLEFAALESAQLAPHPWESWIDRLERAIGHDMDGDQDVDGYSLDFALDRFLAGDTVEAAARYFEREKQRIADAAAA